MKISNRASVVSSSVTLEISAMVKELKAQGKSIIGFTAGEPDFNTPNYIIDSAKDALDKGVTKYTPVSGLMELKKVICEKFEKDNGLKYNPSQIIVSSGAKSSLFHALYAILDKGDEVIIPAPFWFTYEEQIKLCGGVAKIVETKKENGYKITANQLEEAITDKTVAFMINSPSNPTGAVYSKEELINLSKVIEKHGLITISDEIYEKLIYDGEKHVSIASVSKYMYDNTIVVNGVSKTYAMTGWRIGYLSAPKQIADAINKVQSQTTSNACSFAQVASITALSEESNVVEEMRLSFDERRKYMMKRADELGFSYVQPKGAFYLFMNVSKLYGKAYNGKTITDSVDFSKILTEYGVAVIPGKPFYADNFVRLSYAVSLKEIEEGFNRIEKFVKELV